MHGTIFVELQKYVETRLGVEAWPNLKREAGIDRPDGYEPFEIYPDEEVGALVGTASRITGTPATALLEDFGDFIAPDLLDMYWGVIAPEWRTLDVIENTERSIHDVVRLNQKGSTPPYLHATRTAPDEVTVVYTSARRLCAVARGIARGIAKHYNEQLTIDDATCMHRGDANCTMVMRKV
ncbi:MAG TPA: heme NO-binding domain-containing protein [Thermoanaerobaculia bacterium]|nr:heme NO-binding domain-containing protein [Thermoanaerobaculia bacterium]